MFLIYNCIYKWGGGANTAGGLKYVSALHFSEEIYRLNVFVEKNGEW